MRWTIWWFCLGKWHRWGGTVSPNQNIPAGLFIRFCDIEQLSEEQLLARNLMGCCIGEKHSNWCQDNPTGPSYPPVYIDKDGNEYCIFHAPAECKFVELYDERKGGEQPSLMAGEDFNQLVFDRIQGVIDAGEDEEADNFSGYPESWNPRCNFAGTIFHKGIYQPNFLESFDIDLPPTSFHACEFHGRSNFSKTTFNGVASFTMAKFHKSITIRNTTFKSIADFSYSTFKSRASFFATQFRNETYFQFCRFLGYTKFEKSKLKTNVGFLKCEFDDVKFDSTHFLMRTFFIKSIFNKSAYFDNCTFNDVSFEEAKSQKAFRIQDSTLNESNFNSMIFHGSIDFNNSEFSNTADFTNTIFLNYSNFKNTKFQGTALFLHTHFKEWTYFRNAAFKGETTFAGAISKETILIESTDLSNLKLTETNIESFQFTECTWPTINGRKAIYDEKIALESDQTPDYLKLEEIYRRLKKIARQNNDEMQTSAWHYKEKEMMRKRLRQENGPGVIEKIAAKACACLPCDIERTKEKFSKLLTLTEKQRTPFLRFLNSAYWIVSGYGEEPLRAGIWMLIFILGAILPAFFGPEVNQVTNTLSDFIKGWMWYMPLMKVSDVDATGWNYLFKAIFNVTISIQAALFAFALRNKLRR
ncbi:pentapeptide repeat-containing protein [Desulfovibrio sp. JC022]|uniref:pentapeptide repeat-containing protein n=1 Tax=Desulfovibrio sp. JC022 TaxID=2593642 RepID=UPI0013D689BE|nr:pentapeptide repeat-containing protein [Desulfovibrio sp. JC022]NDV23827.1 hypothetical protein [Desulfovibrio sp. JC022]